MANLNNCRPFLNQEPKNKKIKKNKKTCIILIIKETFEMISKLCIVNNFDINFKL